MEETKSFQYPVWVRLLTGGVALFGVAMLLYAVGFFMFLIYISSGSLVVIGTTLIFSLAIFGFFGRSILGAFVTFPQIETETDRIKITGLFFASDWFYFEEIQSVEVYDGPNRSGLFFKNFYVVECEKLPWPSKFVGLPLRKLIGKKGPCFLVGQRIDRFDELATLLERLR